MSLDHLKLTLTQIGILVKQLHKKNYTETNDSLQKLIGEFGLEADRHCLHCLFSCIICNDITLSAAPGPSSPSSISSTTSLHSNSNYSITSGNSSSSSGSLTFASNNQLQQQQQFQAKLLGFFLEQQLKRPSYIANICYAVDNCWPQKNLKQPHIFIKQVVRATGINKLSECVLCLSLTHSSHVDLRKYAREQLTRALPELIESYLGKSQATAGIISSLHDVSLDLLQLLLSYLDEYVPQQHLRTQFLDKLKQEFPRNCVPLILAPYLYQEDYVTLSSLSLREAAAILFLGDTQHQRNFKNTTNHILSNSPNSSLKKKHNFNYNSSTDGITNATANHLTEIPVEDIYENLCETIFLTHKHNNIMDTSWINLILEIGYEFTATVENCKNHLRSGISAGSGNNGINANTGITELGTSPGGTGGVIGNNSNNNKNNGNNGDGNVVAVSRELQAQDVAKIIGLMCRRHISLLDCNVNLPTPANFWPQQQSHNVGTIGNGSSNTTSNGTVVDGGVSGIGQNLSNNNDGTNLSTPSTGSGPLNTTISADKTNLLSATLVNEKKDNSNSNGNAGVSGNGTTDISQAWKPDVFVNALKEIVPQLNWKEVCLELDHPEFIIKDRIGLDLLLTIFRLGTQMQSFPHPECIYRHWQNVEGQYSLIAIILKNPDLFSFADYVFTAAPIDILKTLPDIENKEICAWKSLHLVEVLLYIAEHGYYAQVHDLFKFPMQNCPDILFLSLLHINSPLMALRQELISQLVPTFLSNHPNSISVLSCAWNSTGFGLNLRPLLMHAMSEWYLRGTEFDQVRLSRILDVAQDLKVLSALLNARSFLFIIDLACLASRREYLKLEKWLSDKIREHGEPFIQAMLKCLQRRCPQITNAKLSEDQLPPKQVQLPPDTVNIMLSCLQSCVGSVPHEIADLIMQMSANCTIIANKARAQAAAAAAAAAVVAATGSVGVVPQGPPGLVPPPPSQNLMRGHRALELSGGSQLPAGTSGVPQPQFSANLNAQQMFGPTIDNLTNLTTNIASLNLGGPNGAFNFGSVLNNLTSTPASPSRLMNPTAVSPYSQLNPMQMAAAAAAAAAAAPPPPPPNVGSLSRLPPNTAPPPPQPTPTPTPPNPNNAITDLQAPVSKDIEDEANSYFQRIYNHPPHPTLSIDEVLDILQRFKESNMRREQDVYQCMLRNLFEEYRFFSHYPEKELQITAQLFGGIIERNLVPTFVALGLALRCVLDALRKPEGSKLYYFGITALDRFKTRLHTYNKYCEHIRSIPNFKDFPPHLIQYVEYGYLGQEPPAAKLQMLMAATQQQQQQPQQPSQTQQQAPDAVYRSSSVTGNLVTTPPQQKPMGVTQGLHPARVKSIASATNIDTLLVANQEEKITVPPEAIQDKTAFIFNNLSQLNIPQKVEEIKEIMTKDYWPWLAQYLVLKRASMEFNFHTLYFNFLDALKNLEINKFVTKETIRNIKVLLRSEKGVINFSDRSLLKNLGHWLGMMTLARNKPILQIDLDLKSLLAEAYHKGQQELLFVVPFIAKILESTIKSKVFKVPNPWTMAIMNVLGELHQEPELKLNLKFEIEVLCKSLGLELQKLKPIIYLKDTARYNMIEHQMSQAKAKSSSVDTVATSAAPSTSTSAISGAAVTVACSSTSLSVVTPNTPVTAQQQQQPLPAFTCQGPITIGSSQQQPQMQQPPSVTITESGVHPTIATVGTAQIQLLSESTREVNANTGGQTAGMLLTSGSVNISNSSNNSVASGLNNSTVQSANNTATTAILGVDTNTSSPSSVANDSVNSIVLPAPEPRFSYVDINVTNFQLIAQHIVLSANISFLHVNPNIKHIILSAMERTLTEWLQPVVERSVRIAATTSEQIVRKDFALDPDDHRIRTASHQMVRNLAAGMAMIACKDQITQTLNNNLRKGFMAALPTGATYPDIEAASMQLTNDNLELACAFIQKTAAEKATPEIDRRLAADFEARKIAREENTRYFDAQTLAYQSERMPEAIRLKVGGVPPSQFAVYAEYARHIPGFQPMTERDIAVFLPKPQDLPSSNFAADELGLLYTELATKMETFLNNCVGNSSLQVQAGKMHILLGALVVTRRLRDNDSALNLLNRCVEGFIEGMMNIPEHVEQMKLYRDIHLRLLALIQGTFGAPATERAITKCIFDLREETRYNVDAIKLLINSRFINVGQFDLLLRDSMESGNNYLAVSFATTLLERLLIDERPNNLISETEFIGTLEMLSRLTQHRHRYPEALVHVIDILCGSNAINNPNTVTNTQSTNNSNNNNNNTTTNSNSNLAVNTTSANSNNTNNNSIMDVAQFSGLDRYVSNSTQFIQTAGLQPVRSNDFDDPPGLQEKTEFLLKDWVSIYTQSHNLNREPKNFGAFVQKMNLYGVLKTDDLITRFFRQSSQYCIDLVYRILNDPSHSPVQAKTKIFHWIDAYVHLIALLVRHSGEAANPATKINLLNKVLGIASGLLLQDQEIHGTAFQQVGYHRFFVMLFLELSAPDAVLESLMHSIVTAFAHAYHLINPSSAPGFCYAWLELISHRIFIGRILAQLPQQKGWPLYSQLLMDLFKYLAPFLRNAELAKPVQLLYRGTLRVLLVLLHDFPEFLCDYHFGFCDVIPPNCIQMRNIILAAFPRNMRLPDPFTPNLKVDMLAETASAPKICINYVNNIQPINFKKDLDSYLKARAPVTFLSELRSHLQISNEPGSRYNIPLMNSLVLYVGTQAISHIRSKNFVPNTSNIAHSAHMDIFQNLAVDLDTEGRYLFLNAIANQLRYPNSHTHYFSCAVLHLFAEANSEAIQEQITRVLLERLIVNRPHPWGLLITFIELIKNPIYKFWDHDFVHCAPEISKLFESVARSCMVKSNHPQQLNNIDGGPVENNNLADIN